MDSFFNTFLPITRDLLTGFQTTVKLFALTLLFSLPLGLLISFGSMSKFSPLRWLVRTFVWIIRGTPLMLQLLLVYFGPYYVFRVNLGNNYRFVATIIAFSLNYAAYFAEIFRGGIQSMSQGQYEAATVLGFSKAQTYFKIILPQVVKTVLPSVSNEIITLVKDTSLAQVLSVTEMFTKASAAASKQVSVMPFIVAGLFYYLMNLIIELILNRVEKSMSYYS